MTFSQQMEFTNRENRFMNHCGIRITKLEPECCEAQLSVADYCKNTGETIHGGLLYTMADCVVSAFVGRPPRDPQRRFSLPFQCNRGHPHRPGHAHPFRQDH